MHIELIEPHTHAGRFHAPGEILDLDEAAAQWLIERGVARLADPQPKTQIKTNKEG
jgi:hypothetical protein